MALKPWVVAACLSSLPLMTPAAQTTPPETLSEQFYAAIRSGEIARTSALLDRGADPNVTERRGGATPLMHAAAFGSLDTLKLLLSKDANPNARSAAGATALMWAATDLDKIRVLLDAGADVNATSEMGRSVLLLAAWSDGSAAIVRELLARGANPRVADRANVTTLWAAAAGNDTDTVRQLVAAGAPLDSPDGFLGNTPLMNAATNGNQDVVSLLIARGANVNVVSAPPAAPVKNGIIALGSFTPLLISASHGPSSVVRTLLDAGARIQVADARGLTPLMLAVATDHNDPEVTPLLIARGADLQAKSRDGETALDWALKQGETADVTALRQAGAPASAVAALDIPAPAPVPLRAAVERSVALLERSAGTFFTNGACGACHAQNITDVATMSARMQGVRIDDGAALQRARGAAAAFGSVATRFFERDDGPGAPDLPLYALAALAAAQYPPDRATDALVFSVSAQQRRDGRWHIGGISRPPIEDGDFSRTALGVRALTVYGIPGRATEMRERVERGARWLRTAAARTTEDHSFRLLGSAWAGADAQTIQEMTQALVTLQRPDGSWGQRPELGGDAYATGLAMYALIESGASRQTETALARGTAYLLSQQRADGAWFVRSRAPKFQPYFEGGFPYGHHQWISSMATGWATAALARRLPGTGSSR